MKQHLEMRALPSLLLHCLQISHNALRSMSYQKLILNSKLCVTKECNYWSLSLEDSYRADKKDEHFLKSN